MDAGAFSSLGMLFQACQELRDRLDEAREALTEDEFEAAYEGPFAEILCAAMDVEDVLEQCEKL
jgi:hypothetical protein